MDRPRLTVFSTPLISTFVLDETHRVLFDAGDGATALLEGKIHKAHVVALTHAHRDHIAGLPQLLNLRGGVAAANGQPLRVVHPEGSGSVLAMSRFLAHFDHSTSGMVQWQPMRSGDRIELDGRRFLRSYATQHIPSTDSQPPRSLGYQIGRTVDRVKPELRALDQAALDSLRQAGGRSAITTPEEQILLSVSGDTQVMPPALLHGTRYLLHECTFLDTDNDLRSEAGERGHEHSCLNDVLQMACEAEVEHLGLYHVSKRYSDDEIVRAIRADCARMEIQFHVSVALPGRLTYDLFSQTVWKAGREVD